MGGTQGYARRWKASLEAARPEEYRRLRDSGELDAMAEQVGERASIQFDSLMRHFQQTEGLPETHLERAQALDGMRSRAEDLLMDELLEWGPETGIMRPKHLYGE